jgi:hypothetical protein
MGTLTDDEIIARGDIWGGEILELRQRIVDFTVDGVRYGTQLWPTRSGSPHDRRLDKRSEEIATAAFILGRLGYRNVTIVTRASDGSPLERPDLDATFESGDTVGIEVAQVAPTTRMKHDATIATLEHSVRDLIDSDPAFAASFGPYYLSVSHVSVLGDREAVGTKQGRAILDEIVTFVRAGEHKISRSSEDEQNNGTFAAKYPVLHSRGGTYYSSRAAYGPHFSIMDGGTVNPRPESDQVVRVLNDHRQKAATYRTARTWMLLYLDDSNEIFRSTVLAVKAMNPPIDPFEQCHITDTAWRIATLG